MIRAWLLPTLLLAAPSFAADVPIPAPPQIVASSYLLMDFSSGRIIVESRADERVEPASLTKLMTAYAIFHALRQNQISLEDEVHVSEKAWRTEGSRMFIEVDTTVSVEDLLRGMIIQSGNDASVALAEHVAGRGGFRWADEPACGIARNDWYIIHEHHRTSRRRPLRYRSQYRDALTRDRL